MINLESLNESPNSLNANYLKIALSSDTMDNLISKLGSNPRAEALITGAYEAHNLYNGTIKANTSKEFTLREWIDYDVTKEQGMNKTVTNKINVIAMSDLEVEEMPEVKTQFINYETNAFYGVSTSLINYETPKSEENKITKVVNDENFPFDYDESTGKYTTTNTKNYSMSSIVFSVEKEGTAEICYESIGSGNMMSFLVDGKIIKSDSGISSGCITLENIGPNKDFKVTNLVYNYSGSMSFSIKLSTTPPIKYCISKNNMCEPNTDNNIIYKEKDINLDAGQQILCTKVDNSKIYCSESLNIKELSLQEIFAKYNINNSRSGELTAPFTDETPTTVYSKEDDDGTSYMFAGVNPNNWVKIGDIYFRIIRFNGNGSMRLIYSGTGSAQMSGTGTQISVSAFNSNDNDNAYVGFMYGSTGATTYAATHTNTNSSTIKGVLDTWYTNNINSYASIIDTNAGFCGDRKVSTVSRSGYGTLGYGTNATMYVTVDRYYQNLSWKWQTNYTPSLKCSQSADLYTVAGVNKGNKVLTNPVGLITADEYMLAGGGVPDNGDTYYNTAFWLHTGASYWTMTPSDYYSGSMAKIFHAWRDGSINNNASVRSTYGVRPVINIKFSTIFKDNGADGSAEKPWIVSV